MHVHPQPTDAIPLWLLFVAVCLLIGAALEAGYRFGRWRHEQALDEKETPVGAIVASILGLLAFLLAFTFGLAASRFDDRRQAVLEEANAIGTTYLRTRLLPEPQRTETARLLREYVDVRVRGIQENRIAEALTRSEELHGQLWEEAVKAAENKAGTPVLTGLFVTSLNETIDVHAKRVMVGARSRIPMTIWVGLFCLALAGMSSAGYQAGLSVTRRSPAMMVLVLAFAGVLMLIADLDRANEGFLKVGQEAMLDLQASMQKK